jgi:phosphonate ABC transporter permease subunit PhnE
MRAKPLKPILKSLQLGLAILAGLVVYAYGFQVTQVDLDQIQEPTRQIQLTRVLRALARPDIVRSEQREIQAEAPVYVPCPPEGEPAQPEPATTGPYLVITPSCAEPRSQVQVEGFNLLPGARGRIFFVPPSNVTLNLGEVRVDSSGHFLAPVRLPPRADTAVQHILVITQERAGRLYLTRTALETWDKIIETIFLALLATTLGTLLAIPVSFLAARNIMKDITSTLSALALSIIGWPTGVWLGAWIAGRIGMFSREFGGSPLMNLAGALVGLVSVVFVVSRSLPQEDEGHVDSRLRIARLAGLVVSALAGILVMFFLARLSISIGQGLIPSLGALAFIGSFLVSLGQILEMSIGLIAALIAGSFVSGLAGRLGKRLVESVAANPGLKLGLNILLAMVAGALLLALIGAGIGWLYEIDNPAVVILLPAIVGAALGLILAWRARKVDVLPVGLTVYYIIRTILNALRAIEALILAIVFSVWVGIGPFAGVLALSLHTIAALGKLYSEQVESILPGPLEAVKATGANRIQTIIYAVIPQIIPPYISFTMYRWDINVRMSTIIGFAGGGGIGFLLQQNINVLNYRAASAQMLAIAIVVALMDFLSSYMREKVV